MQTLRVIKGNEVVRVVENKPSKKLISVREFAREYGIGINKAYALANQAGFPMIKNGRNILVIKSKVDEWLEKNIGLEF